MSTARKQTLQIVPPREREEAPPFISDCPEDQRADLLLCFQRGLDDAYTWYCEADLKNKQQLLARARYVQMRARALQIAIGELL